MNALYVSHTGMTEPLGQSQVIPYLRGLSRAGWGIDIVAFEPHHATAQDIARVRDQLAGYGLQYRHMQRSPSHSLVVKAREIASALTVAAKSVAASRPRIVHARSYLPALVADALRTLVPSARFLFDCRGLLADEYADAGHWQRRSFAFHALKLAERRLMRRSDAVVLLTQRIRNWLVDDARLLPATTPVEIVPCCVDLERFQPSRDARAATRAKLEAGERFVLAYSGTLGSWYREDAMAGFFRALRNRVPALFLVISHSPTDRLEGLLQAKGIDRTDYRIVRARPHEMPGYLSGADAGVSFIQPSFSKMASSPTKIAEYLAMGLPVVMNRGVGDGDRLLPSPAIVDAGDMEASQLEDAASALLNVRGTIAARSLAEREFCLERVGVTRYRRIYERLAS